VELEARLGTKRLAPEVETTLYRIVQEALTNVVKHAEAHKISILLARREGSVMAVIEDDGKGLPANGVTSDGVGLLGMQERVELHDGRLTIESTPEAGTTLRIEVPL
jgi:signal transduction histidine kinase